MIEIAVVDDNETMLKMIDEYLRELVATEDDVEIRCFNSGKTFLYRMKNGYRANILFCDIELGDMSGMEVGRIIRQKYPALYLIYLTSHSEFAIESYMLDAYQYILKEHMKERLPQILGQLLNVLKKENKEYRMIGTSTNKQRVYYKDIIAIRKDKASKYVTYTTTLGIYRERKTLELILKELHSNDFILIGRGLAINMRHIAKLSNSVVYLDNGEQKSISRTHMTYIKETINHYWRENQ